MYPHVVRDRLCAGLLLYNNNNKHIYFNIKIIQRVPLQIGAKATPLSEGTSLRTIPELRPRSTLFSIEPI